MPFDIAEIAARLTYLNLAAYILMLIFVEWSVSSLVNRGMARRLGARFAVTYNCNITFLGVIHHELSHAVLALLTGAAIHKICLYRFPWTRKKKKMRWMRTAWAMSPTPAGEYSQYHKSRMR